MIGEVVHHKLLEDGTIPTYDVKFDKKTIKNIPSSKLNAVKIQEHSHAPTEDDEDTTEDTLPPIIPLEDEEPEEDDD